MTTARDVLAELESLGQESFRNTYRRHGAGDDLFGVSTADLKTLAKKLKKNTSLADALWASGNYDACILATMIADPKKADPAMLDRWARTLESYPVADAFAAFVAATPHALDKAQRWVNSKDEYVSSAGWQVLAHLAMKDRSLDDEFFSDRLEVIRRDIKRAPNRTRHNMNGALIAIGLRNPKLQKQAVTIARAIGKVEVDHGNTACVTPDALAYIEKASARKKA